MKSRNNRKRPFVIIQSTLLAVMLTVCGFVPLFAATADAEVRTDKQVYAVDETIEVTATGTTDNEAYVGIYRKDVIPGTENSSSVAWKYVRDATDGKLTFQNISAGDYIVYLFSNGQSTSYVDETPIIVADTVLDTNQQEYTEGDNIEVTVTGSGNEKDYVGVYKKEEIPGTSGVSSVAWKYVKDASNGKLMFQNIPAGEYIVYLIRDDKKTFVFQNKSIQVKKKQQVTVDIDQTAFVAGDSIEVTVAGTDSQEACAAIFQKDAEPGKDQPIVQKLVKEATDGKLTFENLPVGEYIVYVFANSLFANKLAESDPITVSEKDIAAPLSAVYEPAKSFKGSAEGKLTVKAEKNAALDAYAAFWGNADGKLGDYSSFSIPSAGESTTYTIAANTLIPQNADRLLVYSVKKQQHSKNFVTAMLPKNSGSYDFGAPLYEFQVMSDIHLNPSIAIHNEHFASAVRQIKALSPNTKGIMMNGDIVDGYAPANVVEKEWQYMQQVVTEAGLDLSKIYCSIGNHDWNVKTDDQQHQNVGKARELFLKYTNPDSETVYFDEWIGGAHFIFLGSERLGNTVDAELSEDQLDWLSEKLKEDRDKGRPIFLFLHQGLPDTVSGTGTTDDVYADYGWHGVKQAAELAAIIKNYPEVILFSSHTHYIMESERNMKARSKDLPTIFNTAAIGYMSDGKNNVEGSQGYFVKVYKDRVVVSGRDFANEKWLASAQYLVQYGAGEVLPPNTTSEATNSETATQNTSEISSISTSPFPLTGPTGIATVIVALIAAFAGAGIYIANKLLKGGAVGNRSEPQRLDKKH